MSSSSVNVSREVGTRSELRTHRVVANVLCNVRSSSPQCLSTHLAAWAGLGRALRAFVERVASLNMGVCGVEAECGEGPYLRISEHVFSIVAGLTVDDRINRWLSLYRHDATPACPPPPPARRCFPEHRASSGLEFVQVRQFANKQKCAHDLQVRGHRGLAIGRSPGIHRPRCSPHRRPHL